ASFRPPHLRRWAGIQVIGPRPVAAEAAAGATTSSSFRPPHLRRWAGIQVIGPRPVPAEAAAGATTSPSFRQKPRPGRQLHRLPAAAPAAMGRNPSYGALVIP